MVFSPWHWIPSTIAAVLTVLFSLVTEKRRHRILGYAMVCFTLLGLIGYVVEGMVTPLGVNLHAVHAGLGITALLLSIGVFIEGAVFKRVRTRYHCRLGHVAAGCSFAALFVGTVLMTGVVNIQPSGLPTVQVPASSTLPEVEARAFQGIDLTPLRQQGNNAIEGTQQIDRTTYELAVTGLVATELNYSYHDLLQLPAYAQVAWMPCVEGWGFTAKWTGFRVTDLLELVGLEPTATYVVFHCADGYATGLPLTYLQANRTLLAYGLNDVTLPPERGFPFQLVAVNKYGYKWAKWIVRLEVGDEVVKGYWESRGYSNDADVGSYPFG